MPMKMLNRSLIGLLIGLFAASAAQAQIIVDRSVLEFTGASKVQDVEVRNSGKHKIYLDIQVDEIINPESDNPTRVALTDPRSAPVLASPKQLLVQPGERKRVRVILRESAGDRDRVFRMAVKPYTGGVKLNSGAGSQDKASAIKVLVGYDLLILSRPKAANPNLVVKRHGSKIEFENTGNTNVLLRKIVQCDKSMNNCEELQANRLYAGEIYEIDLPKKGDAKDFPVRVWRSVGLDNDVSDY
jgi:P pilus assembly chaperone PapD